MNANLSIPHPGYKIEDMHRSATGATQFRPEKIKEFLEVGAEIIFELERAEQAGVSRKKALQPILEKYGISSDRAGEMRAAATYFGPNTDWPQDIIALVPWSTLQHLSRYKMNDTLRKQTMELIVHYFTHPGCPNSLQPRYERIIVLTDNEPGEIGIRHDNLIREQRQEEPVNTPEPVPAQSILAQPDAFSAAIKQQVQSALEMAIAELQSTILAEKKELSLLLQEANTTITDLRTAYEAEQEKAARLGEELERTRGLLHTANIELSTKQLQIDKVVSANVQLETALSTALTKLGIMERASADVITLFRRAHVVLEDIGSLEGVSTLLAQEHDIIATNGHSSNGYIALMEPSDAN